MDLIREIVEIYDNYDFATESLVASCRHPIHVVEAARMGADIATCRRRSSTRCSTPADQHRAGEVPQGLGKSRRSS
jgi:transaldolase